MCGIFFWKYFFRFSIFFLEERERASHGDTLGRRRTPTPAYCYLVFLSILLTKKKKDGPPIGENSWPKRLARGRPRHPVKFFKTLCIVAQSTFPIEHVNKKTMTSKIIRNREQNDEKKKKKEKKKFLSYIEYALALTNNKNVNTNKPFKIE